MIRSRSNKAKTALLLLVCAASLLNFAACELNPLQDALETPEPENLPEWTTISPGLNYRTFHLEQEEKTLIIVRIDPQKNRFTIAENTKENDRNIQELHEENKALVTFNGAFFTPEFTPTGLLISKNKKIHDLSTAKIMNGIFALDAQNRPKLLYSVTPDISNYPFAIQNGPTLIDEKGNIVVDPEQNQSASRTAIGIDSQNNIIIILVKQNLLHLDNAVTLSELATIIKEKEPLKSLKIHSVLNLDGGTSSGIAIKEKYYPEMEKVDHVILVHPTQKSV